MPLTKAEQYDQLVASRELFRDSWNQLEPEYKTQEKYLDLLSEMDSTQAAVIANDNSDGDKLPDYPKPPVE